MNTLKTFEQYTPSDEVAGTQSNDPFNHHRLIAGYHEHKAKSLAAFADDAGSNPDPRIQKLADNYAKRRNEHSAKAMLHMEEARLHHREEIHGDFYEAIPSEQDCVAYFKTI